MYRRISLLVLLAALAAPSYAPAAGNNDIKELQRDVALLQDMVKQLQASQDKKMADLLAATQQAADSAAKANAAIGAIQNSLQQNIRTQEEKVVTPVVGLSSRMDGLTTELRNTEQNISDMAAQLTRIMALLDDMNKAIKVIQTPPAPPPVVDAGGSNPNGGQPAAEAPVGQPPMDSVPMYNHAYSDYSGGNYDFALTEFTDYLKYFPNQPLASAAQYYIGMIHFAKNDFDTAARDFDTVLEKYPESAQKHLEAQYYKGLSLMRGHHLNEADTEFRELINHHPRTPYAEQACKQIEQLGKHCPTPAPAAGKKSAAKKQ